MVLFWTWRTYGFCREIAGEADEDRGRAHFLAIVKAESMIQYRGRDDEHDRVPVNSKRYCVIS
jgi:hypothetical protein